MGYTSRITKNIINMKTPKPGQFFTYNNVVYRAKKRTKGCNGCALNNYVSCPNIKDARTNNKRLECESNNIILVRMI